LILRKIIKFVATRCQILRLKCTKFDFGWGSAPDPAGGAYSAPPDPLAGLRGPTSKGMGQGKGGEGRGREETGGKGRGGKRRGGEEKGREGRDGPLILPPPTPNLLPPPMGEKGRGRGGEGKGGDGEKGGDGREGKGSGHPKFLPGSSPMSPYPASHVHKRLLLLKSTFSLLQFCHEHTHTCILYMLNEPLYHIKNS